MSWSASYAFIRLTGVDLDRPLRTMLCDKDPGVMSAALCALQVRWPALALWECCELCESVKRPLGKEANNAEACRLCMLFARAHRHQHIVKQTRGTTVAY